VIALILFNIALAAGNVYFYAETGSSTSLAIGVANCLIALVLPRGEA
jgi:hypothetical protein